jgi:hypothetical protein
MINSYKKYCYSFIQLFCLGVGRMNAQDAVITINANEGKQAVSPNI